MTDQKHTEAKKPLRPRFIRREDHVLEPIGPIGKLSPRKPRRPRDADELPAPAPPAYPTLAERIRAEGLKPQLRGKPYGVPPRRDREEN